MQLHDVNNCAGNKMKDMPRYLKQNGEKVPNTRLEHAWYVVPVKSNKDTTPINNESYLIQTRVADYIDLLEKQILKFGKELPKLPIK